MGTSKPKPPNGLSSRQSLRESLNLSLAWVSRAARVTDAVVKHYEEEEAVGISDALRLDHIYAALSDLREAVNSPYP